MNPEVSIVLPIYNASKYIRKTINSILNQDFKNFELIIINDGSKDDSEKICLEIAHNDPRIKYVYQENHGLTYTRNKGINLAKGKYLCFCDHDDIYLQHYLSDNIKLIKGKKVNIVKFGRITKSKDYEIKTNFMKLGNEIIDASKYQKNFITLKRAYLLSYIWDAIFDLEFLRRNHIFFDETLKSGEEDRQFMFELINHNATFMINPNLYYIHFLRGDNTTSKFSSNRIKALQKSIDLEKKIFKKLDILDYYWTFELLDYLRIYIDELHKGLSKKQAKKYIKEYVLKNKLNERSLYSLIEDGYKLPKYIVFLILVKLNQYELLYKLLSK